MPRRIAKEGRTVGEARPTSGRVLLALLNILNVSGRIGGARVLELFSGTGRVALAMLERGAGSILAVESARERAAAVSAAFRKKGADARCLCSDARRILPKLARKSERFGIIFADPPYNLGWGEELIALMTENWSILAREGVFVFEHASRETLPPLGANAPAEREDRAYGDTTLTFYWNGGRTL